MHFKRRRRRAGRVVLFVLAAVLLAALGTGMWLLWPRAMRRDMPSAAAPQGTLRGLRLSWSYPTAAGGLSSGGPEVLDTLFADAAAYAQAHGLNAQFLDVADAELSSIASPADLPRSKAATRRLRALPTLSPATWAVASIKARASAASWFKSLFSVRVCFRMRFRPFY